MAFPWMLAQAPRAAQAKSCHASRWDRSGRGGGRSRAGAGSGVQDYAGLAAVEAAVGAAVASDGRACAASQPGTASAGIGLPSRYP